MRVGVIDVGSNTTRLLVAGVENGGLVPLDKAKVRLSLGEEIERFGRVSDVHVAAAAKAVHTMAAIARRERVASLDVFLTAPGRQAANSAELVATLSRAAGVHARVLSKEEEGHARLPRRRASPLTSRCPSGSQSATSAAPRPRSPSAHPARIPTWIESVDLGSVRLTTRGGDLRAEAAAAFAARCSARGGSRARGRGQRACGAAARRPGARPGRARRGDRDRGEELGA